MGPFWGLDELRIKFYFFFEPLELFVSTLCSLKVADFAELTGLIAGAVAADGQYDERTTARRIAHILRLRHQHVRERRMSRISTTASSFAAQLWERASTTERLQALSPRRSTSAVPLTQAGNSNMVRRFPMERSNNTSTNAENGFWIMNGEMIDNFFFSLDKMFKMKKRGGYFRFQPVPYMETCCIDRYILYIAAIVQVVIMGEIDSNIWRNFIGSKLLKKHLQLLISQHVFLYFNLHICIKSKI